MNQGWECPACKTVYAPTVTKCECQVAKPDWTYRPPAWQPWPSYPWWPNTAKDYIKLIEVLC